MTQVSVGAARPVRFMDGAFLVTWLIETLTTATATVESWEQDSTAATVGAGCTVRDPRVQPSRSAPSSVRVHICIYTVKIAGRLHLLSKTPSQQWGIVPSTRHVR